MKVLINPEYSPDIQKAVRNEYWNYETHRAVVLADKLGKKHEVSLVCDREYTQDKFAFKAICSVCALEKAMQGEYDIIIDMNEYGEFGEIGKARYIQVDGKIDEIKRAPDVWLLTDVNPTDIAKIKEKSCADIRQIDFGALEYDEFEDPFKENVRRIVFYGRIESYEQLVYLNLLSEDLPRNGCELWADFWLGNQHLDKELKDAVVSPNIKNIAQHAGGQFTCDNYLAALPYISRSSVGISFTHKKASPIIDLYHACGLPVVLMTDSNGIAYDASKVNMCGGGIVENYNQLLEACVCMKVGDKEARKERVKGAYGMDNVVNAINEAIEEVCAK